MMHKDKVAQSNEEISNLRLFAEQTKDIEGDIAEERPRRNALCKS